jgi:DNA polymerase III delta subunit
LQSELSRWKDNFSQKFGKDSIFSFDTESFDAQKIIELMSAGGLFSDKKLIIVSGVPADTDADNKLGAKQLDEFTQSFLAREGNLPDSVLLVLIAYKPDKRLKLYKFLQSNAQIKEFLPLSPVQIKLFVKEQL